MTDRGFARGNRPRGKEIAGRRKFIRALGAGTLAGGLGANIIIPARSYAAKKTLKILQWVHFVPAYDEWFNRKYVKEWGEKNDTEVIVDNIHTAGIPARAKAEVAAQKGHDLFLFNWPPPTFEEQVVDMRDVYQECERRMGKPIDLAIKSTYNPKTKKYFAFSPSFTPDPVNWRRRPVLPSRLRQGADELGRGAERRQEDQAAVRHPGGDRPVPGRGHVHGHADHHVFLGRA